MRLDSNACKMEKHDLTPKSKESIFESRKKGPSTQNSTKRAAKERENRHVFCVVDENKLSITESRRRVFSFEK